MRSPGPTRLALAVSLMVLGAYPMSTSADQPRAKPARSTVAAPDKRAVAEADPASRRITVFAVGPDGAREAAWSVDAWSPVVFVSSVGPTLAVGNPDSNLVPKDATDATVLATLYRDGAPVRRITLGEVAPAGQRDETTSGLYWGLHVGFDAEGRYRVETRDKTILAFGTSGPPARSRR